jgi:ABC-type dipeptide/oligopeptide/nickel transport system permease component
MAPTKSIFARKLDLTYVVMFSLQVLIIVAIDIVPFYPVPLQAQSMLDIRQHHIDTYHDRFFTDPPAWFMLYTWLEAVYNLPFCLWVIPALIQGKVHLARRVLR